MLLIWFGVVIVFHLANNGYDRLIFLGTCHMLSHVLKGLNTDAFARTRTILG